MNLLLVLAFLFFVGSLLGWLIELFFRRFISDANPERKWINPGFLVGPYLPLYGFGLCALFLLANIDISFIKNAIWSKIALFAVMAIVMTLIEYIAGLIFIKGMNVKLWDYSNRKWNIQGIICPRFSLLWALLSAVYYFLIHPYVTTSLYWLADHLAFSFFIGFYFGIFAVDLFYSLKLLTKIRRFAADNGIIVKYEKLKQNIRANNDKRREKAKFLFAMRSELTIGEHLKSYLDTEKEKLTAIRNKYKK